jgi:hypothetical protein
MAEDILQKPANNEKEKTSIECLQKALDDTQETIRAYDAKAEILAIILTLLVGVINFSLVNEGSSAHCWIKDLSIISIIIGITALFAVGMVLWPRQNPFKGIETGTKKPKGTYFFILDKTPIFKKLDEFLRQVDATDWKREVAFEALKTSCIRDIKHYWFQWALRCTAVTLLSIVGVMIGIACYG